MLDLALGMEAKNYALKRGPDLQNVLECLKIILPVAAIACAFFFNLWTRAESVHVGYQTQQLREQADKLLQAREQLIVQEQVLTNPEWLDLLARKDLGMVVVRADQVIPTPPSSWESTSLERAGQESLAGSSEPQSPFVY